MKRPAIKTWVVINKKSARHNYQTIRTRLASKTKLWAVVKSNAYGHGLVLFARLADSLGADGFCVDSVIEGIKLRENGVKKPILVLGPTFPNLFADAQKRGIAITISSPEQLTVYKKSKYQPDFHFKIDTGMHRQGFYVKDLPKVIGDGLKGVYTHFASAKDINYPAFTDQQFEEFQKAIKILEKAGCKNLVKHCAATGAALINNKYHLDAVRIGIGLYGLWPSKELRMQLGDKIKFKPVLSWHGLISEVKELRRGDYVGYDLTERVWQPTRLAIIPIGYWHGFDRHLSSSGEVLIKGRRARVVGRVSMDLIAVNVTGIHCKAGDRVTLIGGGIPASELADKIGTTHYEIVTRINPLIERVVV